MVGATWVNAMTYRRAMWKRRVETALAWPWVMLGKILSRFFRPSSSHRLFIFSPSADIGGANMNNADIAKMFGHLHPVVIFSKRPKNNQFLPLYQSPRVALWDIHKKIDNKWYHFVNMFYRGVIAQWINTSAGAVVIGGESLYFHKVFPWLKKNIKTIELSHLDTWFNYTQQFVNDIDLRVFSTRRLMEDATLFYDRQGIAPYLKSRMLFIDNMIPEFEAFITNDHPILEVVFIGRGSPQKRVHLVAAVAKQAYEKQLPLHFSFVGDVSAVVSASDLPYCTFYGNVRDRAAVHRIQQASDILLLTSAFEGLPMAVMEMMALGKAIVSTAVNAIPDYIKDGVNGFLIPDSGGETLIIDNAVVALSRLAADRSLLKAMSLRNYEDAREKFGRELFYKKWKEVIEGE